MDRVAGVAGGMVANESQVWRVWCGAVLTGLVGQALFAWTGLGLNGALLAGLMLVVTLVVVSGLPQKPRREMWFWTAPVIFGGIGLVVYDSAMVQALNIAMILAGCGMMAFTAQRRFGEGALVSSLIAAGGWMVFLAEGIVLMLSTKLQRKPMTEVTKEKLRSTGRGMAIAAPLLLVFGVLLFSADPVFQKMLTPQFKVDGPDLMVRFFLFAGITTFTAGLLGNVLGRSMVDLPPPREMKTQIGVTEFGIVFGSLSVLFGAFMVVQARYLFGGNDLVLATEGLTYAQYARRGFFELVAAAALAIPTVLTMIGMVKAEGDRAGQLVRGLGIVFLGLVGTLLVSAARRMGLYVEVYGLTELRFFVSAAMGWMAGLIVVLGFLVAMQKHRRAGTWVVGTAMAGVLIATVMNPDRTIATVNLSRPDGAMQLDSSYLLTLGSGVTEPLLAASETMPREEAKRVREELFSRFGDRGDLREWTLSEEMARGQVRAAFREASR